MIKNRSIGELAIHIGSGATPKGGSRGYHRTGIPFIRSQNVRDSRLELKGVARISPEIHEAMRRSAVRPNDVLLNITGASIGRSCVVPPDICEANVNQHVCIIRSDREALPSFIQAMLELPRTQHRIRETAAGGSREGLNYQQVSSLTIPWIPLPEQQKLVRIRAGYASVLGHIQNLIIAKREFKRGLMQELLLGQRRFPEFEPTQSWVQTSIGRLPMDWQAVSLGAYAKELSTRNRAGMSEDRVMGVIKGVGLEPMRDHVRASDLSRYKLVPPDAFAYNPMRLNIGSIARNRFSAPCLVSPDYVVFQTNGDLLPAFLDHLRNSHLWQQFVYTAGAGSVRVRIYFRDLSRMVIPLPPLEEQRRIAEVLAMLDREIDLHVRQKAGFEDQRRALMQRFLDGDFVDLAGSRGKEEAHDD